MNLVMTKFMKRVSPFKVIIEFVEIVKHMTRNLEEVFKTKLEVTWFR